VDEVLDGYAKVRHLEFIEIGFGSDVRRTRKVFGEKVAVNARISPVLMKNGSPEEVEKEVMRLIDEGHPLHNFSIDTVGLTFGTPDENVKIARKTAQEYGKIREEPLYREKRPFFYFQKERRFLETVVRSERKTVLIGQSHPIVIIGERINPTGRKDLALALEKGNIDILKKEAIRQMEAGADIIDVNVGISGIDEPELMRKAIVAVQEVTDCPISIDSALPEALQAGLSVCKGKPIINSVNGERDKLNKVLPIVKAYGAAVIGLTMDERGIPEDAEGRLEIARRIVKEAEKIGIPRNDIIIDPIAMAVSSNYKAGIETLRSLQLIRDELGVNQTLGLSNISFGLPDRLSINAIFLAMAVLMGLTCPILDPTSEVMKNALLITNMILGRDEFCLNYLSSKRERPQKRDKPLKIEEGFDALKEAVIYGKRKEAIELTRDALKRGIDPHDIINNYLIPALNIVGERFEKRKIFIPEMMISARTMQACVDIIKPVIKKEATQVLGTVVLGTVFGDLHDIGKNLVKLLLETSGFRVIDLGENVPPERFVDAARQYNAHIVGISSLLTTGDPYVEKTVRAIKESEIGDKVKVICGGAALTLKFVEACGADAYAKDAADGVKKSKALLGITC
jgi:5-methyltetrahydrofolate--homocysteine methyltransferase